jgi:hypothetical protein
MPRGGPDERPRGYARRGGGCGGWTPTLAGGSAFGGAVKPMRRLTATLAGAVVAIVITVVGIALRGELRWFDLIGTAAAFYGFRWFFLNGGISPGYTDPAIEQNRARRAEEREARRARKQ